ncbi:CoA transferase [Synechococcus sp. Tobar12-5m-g]|uniref:CoA transferase n=1 Tax=unclassified Synechococcus TaxID=2626047 RepID=UPI0020CEDE20|nr:MULTISPECIES: CoA transferase [unclassified Synechococcus]MCP9773402.1 CoA transferase [Synechococcus sp. Tobar12-5m-g]MCP9874229.1 CoA transferase [Synechococcus sp. Cruz CV-v-12]
MASVETESVQLALDIIQKALGRRESAYQGKVTIRNSDPLLASRHRFGELMAAAQASLGMCLGDIWHQRGGPVQDVTTDAHAGVHQHHGIAYLRQNGRELGFTDYGAPGSFDDEVGGEFYATRDGRFIKFETLYPRLHDAVYRVLKCAPTPRAVEQVVSTWDAEALERALRDEGAAVGVVRSAEEWRRHPVGARLASKPVVELIKIGESDPIPLPANLPSDGRPLHGINVLDCTHVIGGPITARTLAEFGANVLHLSRVDYPDHLNWRLETDIGKRAAYCDLRDSADRQAFFSLLQDADVFTCSYLNLDKKGISPKILATSKPGIIAHELRCFDFEGEWADFRGFDMLAVAVSGYVDEEGAVDAPLMPVQNIFADYLAGYVGAAAISAALLKRAEEGGSYQVRVSLTRMCMWAQDVGLLDASALSGSRPWADLIREAQLPVETIDGPFGKITYLPSLLEMTDIKPGFDRSTQPLGSSSLSWV